MLGSRDRSPPSCRLLVHPCRGCQDVLPCVAGRHGTVWWDRIVVVIHPLTGTGGRHLSAAVTSSAVSVGCL